ncbi:MAG: FKBP-type peptidyl-prolyl cis-trans isomerase [Alistipes indistinctus]
MWIPSELAYGERGAGQAIGPNEARPVQRSR